MLLLNELRLGLIFKEQTSLTKRFVYIPEIEQNKRSLDGISKTKTAIEEIILDLRKKVATCIEKQTTADCKHDNAELAEDLKFRAIAPLPLRSIHPKDLENITKRAQSNDPASKKEAACFLALLVVQENVRRADAVRQRIDSEGLPEAETPQGRGVGL